MQVVTRDIAFCQALIDATLAARIGLRRYFTCIVAQEAAQKAAPPFARLRDPA